MHAVVATPPKKAYQPPKLAVYGDLSEITKQGGMSTNMDMTTGNSMT